MGARLADDAYGEITRIFLAVPSYALAQFGDAIGNVIRALPPRAALDLLVSPEAVAAAESWRAERGGEIRIHAAPDGLVFTHWTRDALFGASRDGRAVGLLSNRFERHHDAQAARLLSEAAGLPVLGTDAPLDGGNLLVSGDAVLVGADTVDAAGEVHVFDESRRTIPVSSSPHTDGEAVVPSDILPAGWRERRRAGSARGSRQPLFHLDLFIAPAGHAADGRSRWLVGCPRLGSEAIGLGVLAHADADLFDEAARSIADAGGVVIRNPMPIIWTDQPAERMRHWHVLPVNNVIVEIPEAGSPTVIMPCFRDPVWPELGRVDKANASIWEALGFAVRRVHGCLTLAERRGALRCMCNVVERGAHPYVWGQRP